MSHLRTQIRQAIATALTNLTTTSTRVHTKLGEVARLKADAATAEVPALYIRTGRESVSMATVSFPAQLERRLSVEIVGICAGDASETTIDTILAEVETALNASISANTLSGLVESLVITDVDPDADIGLETTFAQVGMTFEALYYTAANAPTAAA